MARVILEIMTMAQMGFMAIGIIFYWITPKEKREQVREIGWLLMLGLALDVIGVGIFYFGGPSMNLWVNLYGMLTVPILALLYRRKIQWNNISVVVLVVTIAFLLFAFANMFIIQGVKAVNSYTHSATGIVVTLASLTYFYYLTQKMPSSSITSLPMFWFNAALLIMYSSSLVYFLGMNYMLTVMKSDMIIPTIALHGFQLIFYWFVWIGLWLNRTQKIKSDRSPQ